MSHILSVDRLVSTYLVPQDHPAPSQVRRDLDEVVRKYINDFCGRALSALLDSRDPAVWLIDRVTVDVLMDLSAAEPEEVAAFWAEKIAESVARTITQGEDGERVMRFANRAEFLAYFLRDLADGTAWSKWYYHQFESLRSLPAAAAIREAMLREPDQAEAALLHLLRTNCISGVAGSLSKADQEKLVQLCSAEEVMPGKKIFGAMLEAWGSAAVHLRRPLDLYLAMRDRHPEFPPAEVRSAVRHALAVEQWRHSRQLAEILAALACNRLSPILAPLTAEHETLLYLRFLTSEDPSLPDRIAELARVQDSTGVEKENLAAKGSEYSRCFASPLGGVFLLLPALIANRDLLAAYGGAEDAVLRYLLFSACLLTNSAESKFEPALAAAAGIETEPEPLVPPQSRPRASFSIDDRDLLPEDLQCIEAAGTGCWPGITLGLSMRSQLVLSAAVLLRSFARRLPGLGRSTFNYLWRNILSGGAMITVSPGRILVELAPRPLEIVLRMAGFHEMRFMPPWMAETEVIVRCNRQ